MKKQSQRATLGGKLSAVLVAAGSSVGLGNIWRFPYVVGDNGGAAFLVIYMLCVLVLGLPLMIAEPRTSTPWAPTGRSTGDGASWATTAWCRPS